MKLKTSSSKTAEIKSIKKSPAVSKALIKEDFRRFWPIPVLAFVAYFLSGIFYILVNYEYLTDKGGSHMASFVESMLEGSYILFVVNMFWVPLLSSLLIFKYLHSSGHVMSAHSQPFTRRTLLNSHSISCALFSILPILATALILLLISKPTYYPADSYFSASEVVNVFARANVLHWAWDSIVVSMFVLVICIVGGMITGTSFHHAVAALGFNVVVPICLFLQVMYYDVYLFGFSSSSSLERLICHTLPEAQMFLPGFLSIGDNIAYILAIVILYIGALFLYNRRKLEKATDGVLFKAFDILITLIFGYLGMTVLGMIFYSVFEASIVITTFGYIVGAILGMLICRMIIMKSIKVINKNTLKIMIAYLVIAILFMLALSFDLTGFEKRIPANIDTVRFETSDAMIPAFEGRYYELDFMYEDKETIDAVKGIHQLIIENKDIVEEYDSNHYYMKPRDYYEDTTFVKFTYYQKGKDGEYINKAERQYAVPIYLLLNSEEYKEYIESSGLRDMYLKNVPEASTIVNMDIGSYQFMQSTDSTVSITDSDEIAGLMAAYKKDMKEYSYEDILSTYGKEALVRIDLSYRIVNYNSDYINQNELMEITGGPAPRTADKKLIESEYYESTSLNITYAHTNTIQWLKDNGYEIMVTFDSAEYPFAEICAIEGTYAENGVYTSIPNSEMDKKIVTDPELINKYYEECRASAYFGKISELSTKEDNIYQIVFYRCNVDSDENNPTYDPAYVGFIKI